MRPIVSLILVIVLPPIIYSVYAQHYNSDTSSLYSVGIYFIFALLAVSLSSIMLYSFLRRNEKQSNVKNNIKFSIASFVVFYAVIWVYGLATREQFRLSHNAFNEGESIPIHAILFTSGLLVNVGTSILIGLIIRRSMEVER